MQSSDSGISQMMQRRTTRHVECCNWDDPKNPILCDAALESRRRPEPPMMYGDAELKINYDPRKEVVISMSEEQWHRRFGPAIVPGKQLPLQHVEPPEPEEYVIEMDPTGRVIFGR